MMRREILQDSILAHDLAQPSGEDHPDHDRIGNLPLDIGDLSGSIEELDNLISRWSSSIPLISQILEGKTSPE